MYIKGKTVLKKDIPLLRATIRLWAHWLDKYRDYCPRPIDEITKNLSFLLQLYDKLDLEVTPDIRWAKDLLGGKSSLSKMSYPSSNTDALNVIYQRRSVRKWNSIPIDDDLLFKILDAGVQAPSSGNMQVVRIKIIRGEEDIQYVLRKTGHRFLSTPSALLVLGSDHRLYTQNGKMRLPQDVAFVAQNMMLAATFFGIGTCYLSNVAFNKPSLHEYFKIPNSIRLISGICLGFCDQWPSSVPKMNVQSFIL